MNNAGILSVTLLGLLLTQVMTLADPQAASPPTVAPSVPTATTPGSLTLDKDADWSADERNNFLKCIENEQARSQHLVQVNRFWSVILTAGAILFSVFSLRASLFYATTFAPASANPSPRRSRWLFLWRISPVLALLSIAFLQSMDFNGKYRIYRQRETSLTRLRAEVSVNRPEFGKKDALAEFDRALESSSD